MPMGQVMSLCEMTSGPANRFPFDNGVKPMRGFDSALPYGGGSSSGEKLMHHSKATQTQLAEQATDLRHVKFRLASRAQREEIVKHRDRMVRKLGHLVSLDTAARDWIRSCADEWRANFEAHWQEPRTA